MRPMRGRSFVIIGVLAGCAEGRADFDSGDVTIVPAMPITTDTMMAQLLVPDPNAQFAWSKDGVLVAHLTTTIVPDSETVRGEVWRVMATDYWGASLGGDEVEILNSAPTAPEISLPSSARADADLLCTMDAPSTDADGDPITYRAEWTENGAAFAGATTTNFEGDTVPAAYVQVGDLFVCTVIADDGIDTATASTSQAMVNDCGGVPVPQPTTFAFTGAPQTYTIPDCVTSIRIEAWGAQGANGGGLGGMASGVMTVVEGNVLVVEVGGRNGYNGGGVGVSSTSPGHGGGASDVRTGPGTVTDRVIVAGGGGGGITPGDVGAYNGGGGGGGTCGANYCGGAGGAGYGGTGGAGGASGGTGITNAHGGGGGGGGETSGGGGACKTYEGTACAPGGTLGAGGGGEPSSANPLCYSNYGGTAGGGGGYYGGGGSASGYCGGGGGGGGSSWTGTMTSPMFTASTRTGDGMITITPLSTQ
jgi:hypothetical protein